MEGILKLNEMDVRKNAAVGAHDPSMMWDPVTEKYYSYSTDVYMSQCGLSERIGIPVRSSADLVHFTYEGTVLSRQAVEESKNNGDFPDTTDFWAPYVEYVNGEYRMYYSATKAFGSSESRIWLAVSKHPLGPFENRGVVMDTWGTDETFPNAIDAHIVWEQGKCWLVYGSFFGGIFIKELDGATGMAKDKNAKTLGICISKKTSPAKIDGPEGAAVIYVEETGYYYLFQSYGWLGDTYDIRVGRSKMVTGPYQDKEGKNLAGETMGDKLAGSYRFTAANPHAAHNANAWSWDGLRGPGHGVPFYDPIRKRYFFVHHIRDGASVYKEYDAKEKRNSYRMHYMMIRAMFFINGWPVLAPEPYTGEDFEPVLPKEAKGCWELIIFDKDNNEIKKAVTRVLHEDSIFLQNSVIHHCYDFENDRRTLAITGFDDSGIAFWGKFMYSIV